MTRSAAPPPPPRDHALVHVVHVLGGTSPGLGSELPSAVTCARLRSLVAGLMAYGVCVTVHAPPEAEAACGITETGARFVPGRARTEPEAVVALRSALAEADLVHAHGLRAATLAGLAREFVRPRIPLVVDWHHREPVEGARERVLRLLERRSARAASVVLGASTELVDHARRQGAHDARLAPFALSVPVSDRAEAGVDHGPKARAEIGAVDRPLLLSVGRLDARRGYRTALDAARAWRRVEPPPLLAVAGEGPERAALQEVIDAEELPVRLLGRRDDALDLLHVTDLAVLPEGGAAPPLFAQEALRAGVPLVGAAEAAAGHLVGEAGMLTPPGDADALAAAVTELLAAPDRLAALASASRARGEALPTEAHSLAHVLSVYDELLTPPPAG